jgi:hypothetical protein
MLHCLVISVFVDVSDVKSEVVKFMFHIFLDSKYINCLLEWEDCSAEFNQLFSRMRLYSDDIIYVPMLPKLVYESRA